MGDDSKDLRIRGWILTAITFVTTTSFGSWLPGDLRGHVHRGITLPGNPRLLNFARSLIKSDPILFSADEQERLSDAIVAAAHEFKYRLADLAIEAWHLHWVIWHDDDSPDVMAGRLKTRMRQALGRGRIWTESYCGEEVRDDAALAQIREYIAHHPGCRITDGRMVTRR